VETKRVSQFAENALRVIAMLSSLLAFDKFGVWLYLHLLAEWSMSAALWEVLPRHARCEAAIPDGAGWVTSWIFGNPDSPLAAA